MSQGEFNSFDDFIKFCRNSCNYSENNNDDCDNCRFGNKNAEASESSRCADSDIPGGFQDIDPQLFTIGTTILGTVIAGKLPFNIQNAVANWLELLSQSISTFNAQQQYFQGGPGRFYDTIYRNAANPFCSTASDESQRNSSTNQQTSNQPTSPTGNTTSNNELEELKAYIKDLNNEVIKLRNEVEKLKNNQ